MRKEKKRQDAQCAKTRVDDLEVRLRVLWSGVHVLPECENGLTGAACHLETPRYNCDGGSSREEDARQT